MAILRKIQLQHSFIQVPNETARASYTKISLQAVGLLVDLMSYPEDWVLHKTEVYKRYAKNKRTSVKNAWEELANEKYILEFKVRNGRKWEYFYYVRLVPFTEDEEKTLYNEASREFGDALRWDVDFQQSKMDSPKPADNKYSIKQKLNKTNIKDIDDDKANFVQPTYTEKELDNIIEGLREVTKNELTKRSFDSVVRKVMDKLNQGKIKSSFRDYLVSSLNAKIEELELRRAKDKAKESIRNTKGNEKPTAYTGKVPIYDWLNEDK